MRAKGSFVKQVQRKKQNERIHVREFKKRKEEGEESKPQEKSPQGWKKLWN